MKVWYSKADKAEWEAPQDIVDTFGKTVDFVADSRAIFDIGGNKFRLIVHISYTYMRVLIKFAGTHSEYDKIDPEPYDERHSANTD